MTDGGGQGRPAADRHGTRAPDTDAPRPRAAGAGARVSVRRAGAIAIVVVALAGGAGAIRAAAGWTASHALFPSPVPSIEQLTSELAAEQARADALQAELDQLTGGSAELATALDEAATRMGADSGTADSVRAGLAAARSRLSALQLALLAAGAPVPSGTPASPMLSPPAPPAAQAPAPSTGGTAAPYPPGVPADWPSSQPIPPMPSGCVQPQLELNGVWNCQH